MSKLSDTQAIVLSAASQRPDGNLLPLPGSLRGGAAAKVVAALLARGLAEERVLDRTTKADAALNTVWRNLDDGRGVLLLITAAGRDALGIEPVSADVRGGRGGGGRRAGARGTPSPPRRPPQEPPRRGRSAADPRGHQAGAPRRPARPPRGRHHRRDRRRHRLAAAHRPRRLRRGAEEAARADGHLGEGRGARPGLSYRLKASPAIRPSDARPGES